MPIPEYDGKDAAVDSSASAAEAVDYGSVKGKSVVITGGASGMGEAMARKFIDAGAFVTIADVNEERGVNLSKEFEGSSQFVKCDVTSWEDQVAVFKAAVSNSPQKSCDVVVANAGIGGLDPFSVPEGNEDPVKPDLKIIETNQIGVIYTANLAFHYFNKQPETEERERCLILTASLTAFVDVHDFLQYTMAKYALRGLKNCFRRTSWVHGVRINLLAPWFVQTPAMSQFHIDLLTKGGIEFALAEDAAAASLRIAADKSVNGRSLGVVPRNMAPTGYLDLKQDDYEDGTLMNDLQQDVITLSKRAAAAAQAAAQAG